MSSSPAKPIGGNRARVRWIAAFLGTFGLSMNLWWVHRWFDMPFAVWAGWDEAYIAAFAGRLIDGHGLPYVDAVSHRGPVLYWLAALFQLLGDRYDWHTMRVASLLSFELVVWLFFAIAAAWKRPLAGFFAAASLVFMSAYGMAPKDGIGFNGEIVALIFTSVSMLSTIAALNYSDDESDRRVWLAVIAGMSGALAGLTKQVAFVHLLPIALWWWARSRKAPQKRRNRIVWMALAIGTATPILSVLALYARAGALRSFFYYFFTYNRQVYLGPISLGYAIESTYLFARDHMGALGASGIVLLWGWSRWVDQPSFFRNQRWLEALDDTATSTIPTLQATLASFAAFATFRFWDHYFLSAIPWVGLTAGVLVEEHLHARNTNESAEKYRADRLSIVATLLLSTFLAALTSLWLTGQRKAGGFPDPRTDPITRYVQRHTAPTDSIFVWGFAPEVYTSAHRHAASRFVFTTFPSGVVPWFPNMTRAQEDHFAVPGTRARLLQELQSKRPKLILDEPSSLQGRSMRRYESLQRFLKNHYCFDRTIRGGYGRVADVYVRRDDQTPCSHPPPALPPIP